ncbi:MAG: hypothetical protein IJF55_01725 [Clostridia bacterium]|nr:hypothetical protein [Clostridia bacterium]
MINSANRKESRSLFNLLFFVFLLLLIYVALKKPSLVAGAASDSLFYCIYRLIPSLFPISVISGIILSGRLYLFLKPITKPLSKLLSVSESSVFAILFGLIVGFPTGCASAGILFKKEYIDGGESRLIALFANNAGVSLIFGAIGARSKYLAILFFISQTLSSLLLIRIFSKKKKEGFPAICEKPLVSSEIIVSSISSALQSMLTLSAFVIFFSVISGVISDIFSLSFFRSALLLSFLEITGALKFCLSDLSKSAPLLLFALTFTGLSVNMQSAALTSGRIPLFYFISARLLHSFISLSFYFLLSFVISFF